MLNKFFSLVCIATLSMALIGCDAGAPVAEPATDAAAEATEAAAEATEAAAEATEAAAETAPAN